MGVFERIKAIDRAFMKTALKHAVFLLEEHTVKESEIPGIVGNAKLLCNDPDPDWGYTNQLYSCADGSQYYVIKAEGKAYIRRTRNKFKSMREWIIWAIQYSPESLSAIAKFQNETKEQTDNEKQ